ncbi:Fanconi anemia group I protein [Neodiprion virginianus]|uniref:Fanconi anemia group I protein n=1 Tax=Neodiprion virginianus TaxID=2961670 RepID=UPI001EE6C5D4|nr:Fanconi anemia group I protein [Neodiprion virginianus]
MDDKIKDLARKKNPSQLTKFIQNVDLKDLCEMIQNKICHMDFPKLQSNILESFNDTASSQSKRLKVVEATLSALQTANITNSQANTIVCRIIMDFPQYSSTYLTKLVEFCQERIRKNDDEFMSWKDILPQVLEVLEDRKIVVNNGSEMSGKEYRETIIKSLYSGQWDTAVLPSVTTMFREISMSKEEHRKVVGILCNRLSSMQPNELPPLVHQLLTFCRQQDAECVIMALCRYFQTQYANALEEDSQECSENIGVLTVKEIQEAESTILYHIFHATEVNQNSLKDFIKSVRNATNIPAYVLDPFIMTLLLNVSDIYENDTLDILRSALSRIIRDNERQKHSSWLREVLDKDCSISSTLNTVIGNSIKDRHMVVKGLVDLAFVLMAMGVKLGEEAHAVVLWEIGNKIIQKLIKKRQEIGPTVLQTLNDKIICGGASVTQYTYCLANICQKVPIVVLECRVWIITLLENLLIINAAAATQVIFAVLPIVRLQSEIRDTLSMVLRKALYSRETQIRKMAVTGFLQLLKNLKLHTLGALSQSTSRGTSSASSTSTYTQASLEVHTKKVEENPRLNTLLCYEVLGILKRCFTQQAEVKSCLYEGLSDAIVMNPELSKYLVEMLLEHFEQYYESNTNILPPFKLDKCTSIRGAESVLQEPIGNLVLVMQRIYVEAASEETNEIEKLGFILESLCNRMSKSELEHFQVDHDIDLLDNIPECQEKLHNLKEMITVYEALIAYRIVTWSNDSTNPAHKIYTLFDGYNRLITRTKPAPKVKKGEGKKKKDKDVTDASFKKPGRNVAIKLPQTILDLETVLKIVTLLYSDTVPWSSQIESRRLQEKELFHRYILQTCIQLMQRTKQLKNNDLRKHKRQDVLKCFEIGEIIYTKIVLQLDDVRNFDQQTAVLGLDCFKELCNLACTSLSSQSDLLNFLRICGKVDTNADLELQLMSVISPVKNLLTNVLEEDDENELIAKRIPSILMKILSLLTLKLPYHGEKIANMLKWLHELAMEREMEQSMAVAVIEFILKIEDYITDYGNSIDKIVYQLCQILGTVDEEESQMQEEDQFKILNDQSALQVHSLICNVLKQKLDNTTWFLSRLRAEQVLTTMPEIGVEERRNALRDKEHKLSSQLCLIVQTLKTLSNISISPGVNADAVFKNLQNLFSTLSMYTRYFYNKSTAQNPVFQAVRFVPLVKLAGKPLAKTLYSLITHIEENQRIKSKSKIVDSYAQRSKVLKETKLIPKVVYEIEQFGKNVLLLSKKTKAGLEEYVNYSITRDFRIKNPVLMKGLEELDVSMLTTQGTSTSTSKSGQSPENSDAEGNTPEPPLKKSKTTRQSQKL